MFSEETKDPRRTVARATYIAVAVTGLLYGLSAWAMSVATGPDNIVAAARADGTDLIFHLVSPYLADSIITIARILFITSLFAALLSFHHTVARYLFALGRERVLPAVFGRTSRRTGAPKVGSLVQSGLALAVHRRLRARRRRPDRAPVLLGHRHRRPRRTDPDDRHLRRRRRLLPPHHPHRKPVALDRSHRQPPRSRSAGSSPSPCASSPPSSASNPTRHCAGHSPPPTPSPRCSASPGR